MALHGSGFNRASADSWATARGVEILTVPQIATLGDSNTFINWGANPTTPTGSINPPTLGVLQAKGYAFWAQTLCDARVEFPQDLNFGVTGETSTDILARVASAANSRASGVVVLAGTNDRGAAALSYATTISNLTAIITALQNARKRIFLFTVPPRGVAASAYFSPGASQLYILYQVNSWIKRVASQLRGVSVIDPWGDIADPNSNTGAFLTGMVDPTDVAHLIPASAYQYGKLLAAEFTRIYPAIDWLPKSNFDAFDATNNPTGVLNSNPMMLGTAGTLSGTTPTPTGQVADSWTLSGSDAGLTLAGSKQTSGRSTLQRIVLGGTPGAGADRIATLNQSITQTGGRVVAGDVIEAFAKVSVSASTNFYGLSMILQEAYDPGGGNVTLDTRCGWNGAGTDNFMPTEAWSGTLRLPPLTIPAGTLSSLQLRLRLWAQQNTAVSVTVDVTGMAARKIVP